jgi:TonB family protein
METIHTTTGMGGYRLKSELARVCLPAPHAHDQRNLAWTNSICLLFLLIGLVGFRPKPPPPIAIKPLEEPQAVVIEAQAPPPPPTVELKPDDNPLEKPDTAPPRVVLVTRESPAIKFSVPTPGGTLIVPMAQSVAPPAPASEPQATAPPRPEPAQPSRLENTGKGGERPTPDYPRMAEQLGQQGTVVLLLTADEAGVIIAVEVKESSGSSILDHAAAEFVKKHWTVAQGERGRLFQARIDYKLTSG